MELVAKAAKELRDKTALEQLNLLALRGSDDRWGSLAGELSFSLDRAKAWKDVDWRRPTPAPTSASRWASSSPGATPADAELVPGFELRAGLEQLGAKASVPQLALRFSLFATPIKDALAGRFGIAVSANVNLASSADGSVRQGDWVITPVAFLGATTNTLLGR